MTDVVIQAFEGLLRGPLSLQAVATLMAAQGVEQGESDRFTKALNLLQRLVSSGALQVQVHSRMEPIHGQWRYFRNYDRDRDSLLDAYKIDPETGRAGQWMISNSHRAGAVLCQREVREQLIAPADLTAMLVRSVGEEVKALGFCSNALNGWLVSSVVSESTKMRRTDIDLQFEFVTKRGELRNFGESWKKVLAAGLEKDDAGLFDLDEVGRVAAKLPSPLTLREKGSCKTLNGRAGAAADGGLSWVPAGLTS
jgi:hypothetical protein